MAGTLKEITVNCEKLHRLKMIEAILDRTYSYVHEVVDRLEDEFNDCADFEDYITESVIRNTQENIMTLNKYLGHKLYADLLKNINK